MTAIILADTAALTAKAPGLRSMLERAADVVELSAESSALALSGMRVQQLLDKIADDLEIAPDLVVDSPEMMAEAQRILGRLAAVAGDSGEIEAERKLMTAPLNAVVKLINAGYGAPRDYVKPIADGLKLKVLAYSREQQRIQAQREAEERAHREEAARAAAAAEAQARREAQEMLAEAAKAQAGGSQIAAQEMAIQAGAMVDQSRQAAQAAIEAMHTAPAVAPAVKAKGVRGKWRAVTVDKATLIAHVAGMIAKGDHSLIGLLEVDEAAATKLAGVLETGFNIPGLRAEWTESLTVRRSAV